MPEPSLDGCGFAPPTLTTASAGCGSSGSRTYSSDGVASSQAPTTTTTSTPTTESAEIRECERSAPRPHRTRALPRRVA